MTVQELINKLQSIDDKEKCIYVGNEETCNIFDITNIDEKEFTIFIEVKKNKFVDGIKNFVDAIKCNN